MRQDAYDLCLGGFHPFEAVGFPFDDKRPPMVQATPCVFLASSLLFLADVLFPKGELLSLKNVFLLTSCFAVVGLSGAYILQNGLQYVNWPKLVELEFLKKREVVVEGKTSGVSFVKSSKYYTPRSSKKD